MKKSIAYFVVFSIVVCLIASSCAPNNLSPNTTENANTVFSQTAYILDIDLENNTLMIGNTLDINYESQTCIFIEKETEILKDLKQSSIQSLAIGDFIFITYTGGIAESAPAQMHHPVEIKVMKPVTEIVYILNIDISNNTIMVGTSMDTDYFDQVKVHIKESTSILIDGIPSQLDQLSIGDQISLTSTGEIMESAPAQLHWPIQIEVIK